ncbi:4e03c49d-b5b0-4125-8f9c-58645fc918c0 [Sclerotinia trifoliorum]|uniref:4e03c49d-b5b0-4125-8f9c-58645fc918c0 n=1 Tax=Sclerotinia trifoliorum TaxID=28548 RepID=A0A8H2VXC8_9HELO|nr:4e03c49d-b5b0-4125-8f9c-58645fc918c0 [Sclerotinia trifoliorum]
MDTPRHKFGPWTRSSIPHTPERTSSTSSNWSFRSISSSASESTGSSAFWRTPRRDKVREKSKVGGKDDRLGRWRMKIWERASWRKGLRMVMERWSGWKTFGGWNGWDRFKIKLKTRMRTLERNLSTRSRRFFRFFAFIMALCLVATCLLYFHPSYLSSPSSSLPEVHSLGSYTPIQPYIPEDANTIKKKSNKKKSDPVQWLKENSNNRYAITIGPKTWKSQLTEWSNPRPKAALISLVRNSELEGMQQSMRQLEARWNHKYLYPWIFFNDEPFSEEFMAGTRNLTGAECFYEVVPEEFWSLPDWVDEGRFMNSLDYLGTIGVGKGWMVHFFCNINYDIFRFMRDNQLKYGFNMNILDDARSFPSLWSKTRAFATAHPELLHPEADLNWLLDGGEYNNCQFFSNFEIGSLRFWRGDDDRHVEKGKKGKKGAHEKYFNYLDHTGGFYYERWGDAPVHTLSVAMFLAKKEVWYFRDVGYRHGINSVCPRERGSCACEEGAG